MVGDERTDGIPCASGGDLSRDCECDALRVMEEGGVEPKDVPRLLDKARNLPKGTGGGVVEEEGLVEGRRLRGLEV